MPSLRSGYTLADFILRLQRSPVAHMSPLYYENRQLFLHRSDVFEKILLSVSWEKSVALLNAAYYGQRVEQSAYAAVLKRMLLHNRHVRRQGLAPVALDASAHGDVRHGAAAVDQWGRGASESGAASLVDWRAALAVYEEALTACGNTVSSSATVTALRLLAPHRRAAAALHILRTAEVNGKATKPMLLEAAECCATADAWQTALRLLTHLHREDPTLLVSSIQSLRPLGSSHRDGSRLPLPDAGAIFPGRDGGVGGASAGAALPDPVQRRVQEALSSVAAVVPWQTTLSSELLFSFLTHLIASTALTADEKVRMLSVSLRQLPWELTVRLLTAYTEPDAVDASVWEELVSALPRPRALTDGPLLTKKKKRKQLKRTREGKRHRKALATANAPQETEMQVDSPVAEQDGTSGNDRQDNDAATLATPLHAGDAVQRDGTPEAADSPPGLNENAQSAADVEPGEELVPSLAPSLIAAVAQTRARLAQCDQSIGAAFLAVLAAKTPSVELAWQLVVQATSTNADPADSSFLQLGEAAREDGDLPADANAGDGTAAGNAAVTVARHHDALQRALGVASTLDVVVRRALLVRCAEESATAGGSGDNTRAARGQEAQTTMDGGDAMCLVAAALLLAQGSSYEATPASVLSPLVLRLRRAREVSVLVRVLQEHIVPTQSLLSEPAMIALFECVLAHNRAVHAMQLHQSQQRQVSLAGQLPASGRSVGGREAVGLPPVHWRSALSWATGLLAPSHERRIVSTGTGPSAGAVTRQEERVIIPEETPLPPRLLWLLVRLCVDAGSPDGALEALGYARRVDKTELPLAAEVKAMLMCMRYNRPFEAEAIVQTATRKYGSAACVPLEQLLNGMRSARVREETIAHETEISGVL